MIGQYELIQYAFIPGKRMTVVPKSVKFKVRHRENNYSNSIGGREGGGG